MLGKKFKILTITLLTLLSTVTFAAVHTQYSSTVCSNTPYLFGCDKLTTSGAHSNTLGDSTVTVNLTFGAPKATAYTATIEPGQVYLFGCQKLSADATETNTLHQVGCECDSTVTLTLQVQAPAPTSVTVAYTANIYDGETYLFGCQKLTAAGPYTETFQRAGGGDSIVNLTLVVNPVPVQDVTVAYTADIFDGETYLFGCQKLTAAGAYTETFQRVGGGDSIVNLTLNVNQAPVQKVTVEYNSEIEVGQTYLFGCQKYTYTETGLQTLKDSVPAVNGGDSIIIVHLTVSAGGAAQKDTVVGYTSSIYTGETYLFGCQKLTTAGVYKDTLQRENVIGDSVVVLTLNVVEPSVTVAYTANIYDGETYLFGCQKLTVAGPYTETFQRAAGGDSIVNLTLNVNPIPDVTVAYDATIKQGETYLFGCQKLTTAGSYTETFQRAVSGDSIVNLTLSVLNETYGDTTAVVCDSIWWYGTKYTTSGDYSYTFIDGNIFGGDSILTMHLTVNYATIGDTTAVVCDSLWWHGTKYTTSGDYEYTMTNLAGCDSVVTLHLTVNNSAATIRPAEISCDSLYWAEADTTIYTSGTYTHVFQTIHGCDSVVTFDVTINYSAATIRPAEIACDSLYWAEADTTIYTSGTYTHVFQTVLTCDSVVTFDVTINYSATTTLDTVKECNKYYWSAVDTLITTTGTYTHLFQTVAGCDSVVTLPVEIEIPYEASLSLIHKFGDRLLLINRNEINALPGWQLDSLDIEHPEYVIWYEIDPSGNEKIVGQGYHYNLASGDPLPAGYTYYAVITIPATTGNCGTEGKTQQYTIPAAAGAPALMPSLARPGEDIRIINLNPEKETTIRIFTAEGVLQRTHTVRGEETFTIKAAYGQGFYLVELSGEDMKSTLRYIVK